MAVVHRNALKHGLSEREVAFAWENFAIGAVRVPGEREVRIGYTASGIEVEMVGALLATGEWLVYHALSLATKKVKLEIRRARGRS